MKRLSEKGFTLVEIIAVIAIMGILGGVASGSVMGSINKSHEEYCASQTDMLTVAGKNYYNDNITKLPVDIGSSSCVRLNDLVSLRYIDPLMDYDKKACNGIDSKVCAIKATKTSYYYNTILSCGGCNKEGAVNNEATPKVSFSPNSGTNTNNKDISVTMNINGNGGDVMSYKYEVYKLVNGSYNMISNSEALYNSNKTIKIKLNKTGTYYIKGYAYNTNGKSGYTKSGNYVLNYTLNCTNQIKFTSPSRDEAGNVKWVAGDLNIKVTSSGAAEVYNVYVSNGGEYQLVKSNVSGTYNYTAKDTGKYKLKVEAYGSDASCSVESETYLLDNTSPSCTSSGGSDSWTNAEKIVINGACTDAESGCQQATVSNTINKDMNSVVSPGTVVDKVGNKTICPTDQKVKRDTKKPDCQINLPNAKKGTSPYFKSELKATLSIIDDGTGSPISGKDLVKQQGKVPTVSYNGVTEVSQTDTEKFTYIKGFVKDEAGNAKSCNIETGLEGSPHNFKVDSKAPTCKLKLSSDSKPTETNWYNDDVKITFDSPSDTGGSGVKTCKLNGTAINCSKGLRTVTTDTDRNGINYQGEVIDNAGNTSGKCTATVKRDTKKPTLVSADIIKVEGPVCHDGNTYGEQILSPGKYGTLTVTFSAHVKDSLSGVGSVRLILAPVAWVDTVSLKGTQSHPEVKLFDKSHWPDDANYIVETTNIINTLDGNGRKDVTITGKVQVKVGKYSNGRYYCFDYSTAVQALDKAGNWN